MTKMKVTAEDRLRAMVLTALIMTRTKQVDLAARVGFSPKHINQLVRGKTRLHVDLADTLLRAMGFELVLSYQPLPPQEPEPRKPPRMAR